MDEFNPYAPPKADLKARPPVEGDAWRDGMLLVVRRGAWLPDRCLKCNEPSFGWTEKRRLTWAPPFRLVVSSWTADVALPLCPRHRLSIRRAVWTSWGLVIAGLASLFAMPAAASAVLPSSVDSTGLCVALGAFMLLAAAVYGPTKSQVASPAKIDLNYIWLNGVDHRFLDTLPAWPG